MQSGYEVSLIAHGGEMIRRTIVAVENGYLFVCRPEEYTAARQSGREPVSIGFRAEYLRGDKQANIL